MAEETDDIAAPSAGVRKYRSTLNQNGIRTDQVIELSEAEAEDWASEIEAGFLVPVVGE